MKKAIKKIGAAISAAVISASCLTASASADLIVPGTKIVDLGTYTGWARNEHGLKLYYENGKLVTEPKVIDGIEYNADFSGFLTKPEEDLSRYTGWAEAENQHYKYYFVNGVKQTKSKVIDGKRYGFTTSGISTGPYSGWTGSSKGKRYWNYGILQKNKWLPTVDGKYYYAGENGYMTVGWSDVTRIGGVYSYFDENGVWDGKVYWSKSDPEASLEKMLTEKVRIKIKPVQTVNGADKKWRKKEKQYLENSSTYELEIPLAVAEALKVGDTVIVNPSLKRGEGKDEYYLTMTVGDDSFAPTDKNNSGVIDENEYITSLQNRLNLFNELLVIRDDKLMLDRMFEVLGLSWKEIKENKEFAANIEAYHEYVFCDVSEEAYGLFGGYNEFDKETGKYVYRDSMSKNELLDLMKNVRADVLASYKEDEETESDTDYFDWVSNSGGFWLEATVEEIPTVS